MAKTRFDARFNGPPDVVNGGYACATVASPLGASAAEVTLRLPVPVDTELTLDGDESRVTLVNAAGDLLAVGVPGSVDLELPEPVPLAIAESAMQNSPTRDAGAFGFPCFVCSPRREDGFRVTAGPVPGRDVVAAVWRPAAEFADGDERVPEAFAWALLDCTGSIGAMLANSVPQGAVLGRMTAEITSAIAIGEPLIAVGWAQPADGRKLPAGAALYRENGELVGRAKLVCFAA